jgi:SAM-dependent methyltransferase
MKELLKQLKDLTIDELKSYKKQSGEINTNHKEYNNLIIDYSTNFTALSNRYIPPYSAKETHGKNTYDGIINLINKINPKNILDLGCAAGEMLHELDNNQRTLYGVTIHVGEVIKARIDYNLNLIIPEDMRNIDQLFENEELDMIVSHRAMPWLPIEDREKLLDKIYKILKPNGYFIHVSEGDIDKIPSNHSFTIEELKEKINTNGLLTILRK